MIVLEKHPLATLPVPSTSFTEDPVFMHPGGEAELHCEYERDGLTVRGGIRFDGVRAFRFRSEGHCTVWHLEDAYDTLVEVSPSNWVAELSDAEPSETGGHWVMRHFLIFIDSAGAYEIAASSWSWLQETVDSGDAYQ
ncbi:hypothetical protein ACXZ65_21285 [Streptomyces aculeolatus]